MSIVLYFYNQNEPLTIIKNFKIGTFNENEKIYSTESSEIGKFWLIINCFLLNS